MSPHEKSEETSLSVEARARPSDQVALKQTTEDASRLPCSSLLRDHASSKQAATLNQRRSLPTYPMGVLNWLDSSIIINWKPADKRVKRVASADCVDSRTVVSKMADGLAPQDPPLLADGQRSWRREWAALAILFFVNLINYMDRVTIAAVLPKVEKQYNLDAKQSGVLQTAFVISYMVFAPLFGYLGDRYSRKILMAGGVLFWSATTLLGSWPPENFNVFLALRALVGVGEASYSTIAPTIIGDMFPEDKRTLALGVFYYAIPIGSGMGYMIGSNVAIWTGYWYYALRVTPFLGLVAAVLILFVLREPPRGEADGDIHIASTSITEDLRDLAGNASYIWSTLGFTAATFALGAMSWWAPTFMERAERTRTSPDHDDSGKINLIFGAITCIGGAVGITLAVVLSNRLRPRFKRVDPVICGGGLLIGAPLILAAVLLASVAPTATWIFFFFGLTLLSLNWSVVPDMLLYTVVPSRRGTASAIQILVSHMFGDAASPYIVGAISDARGADKENAEELFGALRDAMLLPCAILVVGGFVFILNVFTILRDKERCQRQMQGVANDNSKAELCVEFESSGSCSPQPLNGIAEDGDDGGPRSGGGVRVVSSKEASSRWRNEGHDNELAEDILADECDLPTLPVEFVSVVKF